MSSMFTTEVAEYAGEGNKTHLPSALSATSVVYFGDSVPRPAFPAATTGHARGPCSQLIDHSYDTVFESGDVEIDE